MSSKGTSQEKPSFASRLREEVFKYSVVSGYLFMSFSLLLLYEATTTGGEQTVLPFSIALVKALVLGKFLLLGDAMKVGSRAEAHPLLQRVALKSLLFLCVLLLFTALEEQIVGWFHGQSPAEVLHEFLQRSWLENLAPVLVMLLILIPLISVSEIYRQLGPQRFRQMWLSSPAQGNDS